MAQIYAKNLLFSTADAAQCRGEQEKKEKGNEIQEAISGLI